MKEQLMLTQEQITNNAKEIASLIEEYVKSDRKQMIIEMLKKIGTNFFTAPASTKKSFHSAFAGGLALHSLNVTKRLLDIATILAPEVNKESLVIVGLFHDGGKNVTTSGQDVYIVNPSEWHRDKLGKMYELNPEIRDGLTTAQRSLRLLMHHKVELSDDEFQAILFHDGQYVEENKTVANKESKLLFLLQVADFWVSHFVGI